MSKFNIEDSNFWRNLLSKVLLIFITVAIIVWFLPRNSGPQFRYDIGKPLMYGSFITKFDFPIYKTDEAIKAERDSLSDEFEPYYAYATDVEKEKIAEFRNDFKNGMQMYGNNLIVGKDCLIGKDHGLIIFYNEIESINRYLSRSDSEKWYIQITADGKKYKLCEITKNIGEWKKLTAHLTLKNNCIHIF